MNSIEQMVKKIVDSVKVECEVQWFSAVSILITHVYSSTTKITMELNIDERINLYNSIRIRYEITQSDEEVSNTLYVGDISGPASTAPDNLLLRFAPACEKPWVVTDLNHRECVYLLNRISESGSGYKKLVEEIIIAAHKAELLDKLCLLLRGAISTRAEDAGVSRAEARKHFDHVVKMLVAAEELAK